MPSLNLTFEPPLLEEYVEVGVDKTTYAFDQLFTYRLPTDLIGDVQVGQRVIVPFGRSNRPRVAMVLRTGCKAVDRAKTILQLLDRTPILLPSMVEMAFWMKERYYCTFFEAIKLMLPVGLDFRVFSGYQLSNLLQPLVEENFSQWQWLLITCLQKAGKPLPIDKVDKLVDAKDLDHTQELADLLDRGVLTKVSLTASRVGDSSAKMLRANDAFSGKLTPRQSEIIQTLLDVGPASEKEILYFTGASKSTITTLEKKGALTSFMLETYRRPEQMKTKPIDRTITLSPSQQKALDSLVSLYDQNIAHTALMYGVTGSGKTSVFLALIDVVLRSGKSVIVMVPEIALTAQTVQLFTIMFGDQVAIFHSGLSLGERMDEWKRVQRGIATIAVGTRSAVFAPVEHLGLIVMDEEQEHSYKSESSPRYDAREVARWRCAKETAMCLFCSATPSMESFFMAKNDKYSLHVLEDRYGSAELPDVEIVDMNIDALLNSGGLFSRRLLESLAENFQDGRQSILLLNRRGYHTCVICTQCREAISCPHCSISLTFHQANQRLMCHYCGYSIPVVKTCSLCGGQTLSFRGAGTQRAESELHELIPKARILRLDTDTINEKFALEKKLDDFANGMYDIMVGTQMVAKGLDFANVTLVGVVSADQMLLSDDFRSNERTFDLLTQVVGRAGRGKLKGRALIQTFMPENAYIELAAKQDYLAFYDREIIFRKALLYPPFVDLLVVSFSGEVLDRVRSAALWFMRELGKLASSQYANLPMRVLEASPAAIAKVSNRHRYKIIVKCKNNASFRDMVKKLLALYYQQKEFKGISITPDNNPYHIL